MGERKEALWRILVLIVSGIILGLWTHLIGFLTLIHWLYAIITGKRSKNLAKFNNYWVTFSYRFYRYIGFSTNERPWPFEDFGKVMEKTDMRKTPKK